MNPFARGFKPLCQARKVRPRGKRLLLRAVLATDASATKATLDDGKAFVSTVKPDFTSAIAYEVQAVGDLVDDVKPGDFVDIVAAAAEMIEDGEYLLCHSDDVACVLDVADLLDAVEPDSMPLPPVGSALRALMDASTPG